MKELKIQNERLREELNKVLFNDCKIIQAYDNRNRIPMPEEFKM
jgi:hypothetical protein